MSTMDDIKEHSIRMRALMRGPDTRSRRSVKLGVYRLSEIDLDEKLRAAGVSTRGTLKVRRDRLIQALLRTAEPENPEIPWYPLIDDTIRRIEDDSRNEELQTAEEEVEREVSEGELDFEGLEEQSDVERAHDSQSDDDHLAEASGENRVNLQDDRQSEEHMSWTDHLPVTCSSAPTATSTTVTTVTTSGSSGVATTMSSQWPTAIPTIYRLGDVPGLEGTHNRILEYFEKHPDVLQYYHSLVLPVRPRVQLAPLPTTIAYGPQAILPATPITPGNVPLWNSTPAPKNTQSRNATDVYSTPNADPPPTLMDEGTGQDRLVDDLMEEHSECEMRAYAEIQADLERSIREQRVRKGTARRQRESEKARVAQEERIAQEVEERVAAIQKRDREIREKSKQKALLEQRRRDAALTQQREAARAREAREIAQQQAEAVTLEQELARLAQEEERITLERERLLSSRPRQTRPAIGSMPATRNQPANERNRAGAGRESADIGKTDRAKNLGRNPLDAWKLSGVTSDSDDDCPPVRPRRRRPYRESSLPRCCTGQSNKNLQGLGSSLQRRRAQRRR